MKVLSSLAQDILLEASNTGSLLYFQGQTGKRRLVINNRCFGDGSPIENTANEVALTELVSRGFIFPVSIIERIYKLATEGYLLADKLANGPFN